MGNTDVAILHYFLVPLQSGYMHLPQYYIDYIATIPHTV